MRLGVFCCSPAFTSRSKCLVMFAVDRHFPPDIAGVATWVATFPFAEYQVGVEAIAYSESVRAEGSTSIAFSVFLRTILPFASHAQPSLIFLRILFAFLSENGSWTI